MKLDDIIANFARLSLDAIGIGYCPPGEEWARHVWSNDKFKELFGDTDTEIGGRRIELIFDPDGLEELVAQVRSAIQNCAPSVQIEAWTRRGDGFRFLANANIFFFPSDGAGGRFSVAVYRDVTELREQNRAAEQALVEREALAAEVMELQDRFMAAINSLPGPLAIWDRDMRLVVCNSAFAPRMFGVDEPPQPGTRVEDVIHKAAMSGQFSEAKGQEEEWYEAAIAGLYTGEINDRTPYSDGRIFQANSTRSDNGDMLILSTDVTEFVEQEQKLEEYASELRKINTEMEYKAFHDDLTGLWNRRYVASRLDEIVAEDTVGDRRLAVLQIDLDRFKHINDTLGHAAGDCVLCTVAERIKASVREQDEVARLGGDEFVVLLRFFELSDLTRIANRIVDSLSEPVQYGDAEIRAGGSVGVAHTPVSDAEALLINADIALYRAKDSGRSRAWVFAQSDLEEMRAQKALADDILRGLEADEFEPFFQPQTDARTGEVVGLEVMVRCRHPVRGVLAPAAFLETADELGQLGEIDRRMYRKAIDMVAHAEFAGTRPGVSFNISNTSLMSEDLIAVAREAGRAPFDVAFELLETIYLEEESEAVLLRLDALRDAGVVIEIDDFGSGRASIVALQHIAPDRMKIDRRLIGPIIESEQSRNLVRSIVDIGHTLGIGVTAEGVETAEHVDILRDIGIDRLQGYHIAKPLPFEEVERIYCTVKHLSAGE